MPTDDKNQSGTPKIAKRMRLILHSPDRRSSKAQYALLKSHRHLVEICTTFEQLDSVSERSVDWLIVDLDGVGMTLGEYVKEIRSRGREFPTIYLANPFGEYTIEVVEQFQTSTSKPAHLLWQPINIEQFFRLIDPADN